VIYLFPLLLYVGGFEPCPGANRTLLDTAVFTYLAFVRFRWSGGWSELGELRNGQFT